MIILFINILGHKVFVYEYNFYLKKWNDKINIFEQLNRNGLIHARVKKIIQSNFQTMMHSKQVEILDKKTRKFVKPFP